MKKTTITAAMILTTLCMGCQYMQSQPEADVPQAVDIQTAKDVITELCICHAVNPDGSILLWGDRCEDDKFFAYTVRNTIDDIAVGDEIVIQYSETARQHASVRKEKGCLLFYLKSPEYKLLEISPELVQEACEGNRRNKYVHEYELEVEDESKKDGDSSTSQIIALPAASASTESSESSLDEKPKENEQEDAPKAVSNKQEYSFDMDNTAITVSEGVYHLECTETDKSIKIRINARSFTFSKRYKYCFANTILSVDSDTVMCSTHTIPGMNDMLIYLNSSDQLQAGLIKELESAPDNMYLITITPVPITTLK